MAITGIITSIQRMSIHDGPGIRSTVFLKGCNFKCPWCHNPETISQTRNLQFVPSKCSSCCTCIAYCTQKAISFNNQNKSIEINRRLCNICGICTEKCTNNALSIIGKKISASDVFSELISDKIFFETSGGGVTISGGEPLIQEKFCTEILKECQKEGIHTAIESNMSANWDTIEKVDKYVNLWMCDIKFINNTEHIKWTRHNNLNTLSNICTLAQTGKKIIVRTPVIPGINDSESEIRKICQLLSRHNTKCNISYELLGFHNLGFVKYSNLGIRNTMEGKQCINTEKLAKLKSIIQEYNL